MSFAVLLLITDLMIVHAHNYAGIVPAIPAKNYGKSGTGGSIELAFDSTDSFSTSATAYPCRDPKLTTLTVPCQSLPQVFEEKRIDTCDLLKIDCEGSEFDILYACPEPVLAKVRQMAVEVHEGPGPDRNIDALADFLEANRFRTNRDGHMLYAAPVR